MSEPAPADGSCDRCGLGRAASTHLKPWGEVWGRPIGNAQPLRTHAFEPKPAPADDDRERIETVGLALLQSGLCGSNEPTAEQMHQILAPILRPLIEGKRRAEGDREASNAQMRIALKRAEAAEEGKRRAEAALAIQLDAGEKLMDEFNTATNGAVTLRDQLRREREAGEILEKALAEIAGMRRLQRPVIVAVRMGRIAEAALAAAEEARRGPKGGERG